MKRLAFFGLVIGVCAGMATCGGTGATTAGAGGNGGTTVATTESGTMSTASMTTGMPSSTAAGLGGFTGSGGGSGTGGIDQCAGTATKAELIPLDIYFMLDTSGSMADKTGPNAMGPSKWDAVSQALTTFFNDPMSAGLGAGLQFFPLTTPGVPASCTDSSQCINGSGPCVLNTCTKEPNIVPCDMNTPCKMGEQCVQLGMCGNLYCAPPGGFCLQNFQPCVALQSSVCAHPDSCTIQDYATPAVEIDVLNGAAAKLNAAIMAKSPAGATPTGPALQGLISHAQTWATANPTHTVVAVMATDGLPTECPPTDIPTISGYAAMGLAGNPSIKTFVIGVFSAADMMAQMNLDAIAAAGGTNKAFIVDPAQNVEAAFEAALQAIRGSKLACEFQIPPPTDGGTLDFGQVNVKYTPPGGGKPVTIAYVADMAHCDPNTGGWYYDVDPAKGGTPTKIIMCPQTCMSFGGMGEVDIELGCTTVTMPPK